MHLFLKCVLYTFFLFRLKIFPIFVGQTHCISFALLQSSFHSKQMRLNKKWTEEIKQMKIYILFARCCCENECNAGMNPQNLIMINGAFYFIGQCLHFQIANAECSVSSVLYNAISYSRSEYVNRSTNVYETVLNICCSFAFLNQIFFIVAYAPYRNQCHML